jgi:hypothetical protein
LDPVVVSQAVSPSEMLEEGDIEDEFDEPRDAAKSKLAGVSGLWTEEISDKDIRLSSNLEA